MGSPAQSRGTHLWRTFFCNNFSRIQYTIEIYGRPVPQTFQGMEDSILSLQLVQSGFRRVEK